MERARSQGIVTWCKVLCRPLCWWDWCKPQKVSHVIFSYLNPVPSECKAGKLITVTFGAFHYHVGPFFGLTDHGSQAVLRSSECVEVWSLFVVVNRWIASHVTWSIHVLILKADFPLLLVPSVASFSRILTGAWRVCSLAVAMRSTPAC